MGQILYRNVRGPGVPKGYAMAGIRRAFNPASIPGLALWLTGRTAYCYTDDAGTVPAVATDPVAVEKSPVASLLSAIQTVSGKRPTTETGGIKFNVTDGFMDLSATVNITGDFTVYFAGTIVAGANFCPLGSSAGDNAFIRFNDNNLYLCTSVAATAILAYSTAGLVLFRVRRTGGSVYVTATGAIEQIVADPGGTLSITATGARVGSGQFNGSLNHRHLTRLIYTRSLTAPEQAEVEGYILSVDGVSL